MSRIVVIEKNKDGTFEVGVRMVDTKMLIGPLEKAKTVIERYVPIFEQQNTPYEIDCAITLLKEQEAVKPIITPWIEDEDGNVVLEKKECRKCGYQFFTVRPNFCENCGTPILWE